MLPLYVPTSLRISVDSYILFTGHNSYLPVYRPIFLPPRLWKLPWGKKPRCSIGSDTLSVTTFLCSRRLLQCRRRCVYFISVPTSSTYFLIFLPPYLLPYIPILPSSLYWYLPTYLSMFLPPYLRLHATSLYSYLITYILIFLHSYLPPKIPPSWSSSLYL